MTQGDEDRKDFEEIREISQGSRRQRINPRKSPHRGAGIRICTVGTKDNEVYFSALQFWEWQFHLKTGFSFESIVGHLDPIYECDDIENVSIFVTNIVNVQVNFGKSP